MRFQRSSKVTIVFFHEEAIIFGGGLGREVEREIRLSWMARGHSFDGADDFHEVGRPSFVVRGGGCWGMTHFSSGIMDT